MYSEVVAVIGLCVFLALWHGGGYLYNRHRGQRLFRWLKTGLDVLGGERESGWLGSPASGARVNITHAAPPFRRLEITLLLKNREILPLWLLDRLRGKQDWLIIKATLRSPRRGAVEIVPAKGRMAQALLKEQKNPWMLQEGPYGLVIAYRSSGTRQQMAELSSWLETYGMHLHRFSWCKTDPHVQLQVKAGGLLLTSSETFLMDLQTVVGKSNAH
ncbi:MAG: hypothetical protein SXV54_18250 [Chloroflexota bacterium]|nr:hypothetical protein [Chloroflexota bacterium]